MSIPKSIFHISAIAPKNRHFEQYEEDWADLQDAITGQLEYHYGFDVKYEKRSDNYTDEQVFSAGRKNQDPLWRFSFHFYICDPKEDFEAEWGLNSIWINGQRFRSDHRAISFICERIESDMQECVPLDQTNQKRDIGCSILSSRKESEVITMTHEAYERLENTFAELDAYQTLKKMYEMTDEAGRLCIPAWPYDDCEYEEKVYQLKMTWKEPDVETLFREYADLFLGIGAIAEVNGDLYEDYDEKENEKLIGPAFLNIWKTYLRPLDVDGLSFEKFYAISEKKEFGEEVSPEEETYYREYVDKKHADAASRIGGKFAKYDVIVRAQRLYKLIACDAPKVIIDNEERYLVQAMAVNQYATEMEEVKL